MSINEYLKIPPPSPSIQSPPISQNNNSTHTNTPPQLSINDQIKICSMKYKITKNMSDMFQLTNLSVSPFRNTYILHFLCLLIEKYKNDSDQHILVRLHGIIESTFRTNTISINLIDECIYLLTNPRVVESIYLFTI
jgi:hypothetical protein